MASNKMIKDNCTFCHPDKLKLQQFYENDDFIAITCIEPHSNGHVIIICINPAYAHAGDVEYEELAQSRSGAVCAAHRKLKIYHGDSPPIKYEIHQMNEFGSENGRNGHWHMHIIPVFDFTGDDIKYWRRNNSTEIHPPPRGFWLQSAKESQKNHQDFDKKTSQDRAYELAIKLREL